MNSNQILGFCIPTCYPDEAFKNLLSDESLTNLKPLTKVMSFLINFQKPWDSELIEKAINKIKDYGFNVEYKFNEYIIEKKGYIPFNKIRNDCSMLLDCGIYALIDDDFLFKKRYKRISGIQYLEGLHYMTTHEKCGILSFRNRMRETDKPLENNHISITPLHSYYGTWLGLFLRSMKNITNEGKLFPNSSLGLFGGGEEKLLAAYRLYNGLYPARTTNTYVKHRATEVDDRKKLGWCTLDILNENINKFIKDNYNPDFEMSYSYDLIKPEDYISKGGIMYDDKSSKELEVNYHKSDYDKLENEIIEYWRSK